MAVLARPVNSYATFAVEPFFIAPNTQANAAGVIPSMRAACAKEVGLVRASFWRSSVDRLGMAA